MSDIQSLSMEQPVQVPVVRRRPEKKKLSDAEVMEKLSKYNVTWTVCSGSSHQYKTFEHISNFDNSFFFFYWKKLFFLKLACKFHWEPNKD